MECLPREGLPSALYYMQISFEVPSLNWGFKITLGLDNYSTGQGKININHRHNLHKETYDQRKMIDVLDKEQLPYN